MSTMTATVINHVALRAAAEAARGANLARKDKTHVPFSMNPDAVIALLDLAACWRGEAAQATRSRSDAWAVADQAKAELAASLKHQADLEAANTHLRERNEGFVRSEAVILKVNKQLREDLDFAKVACALAWEAAHADRQLRSSDAGAALEEAWPLLCAVLKRLEHEPGRCAFQCDGVAHSMKAKEFDAAAAAAAAQEGVSDAPQA